MTDPRLEPVTIHVTHVLRTTANAALCEIDGEEFWLPHSQCDPQLEYEDDDIDVDIPRWLAEEKGLD
jgi:hypothetical protein